MNKKLMVGIVILAVAGIVGFVIYRVIFPIDIFGMQGVSMEPTVLDGEKVALNKFDQQYKRGDIVVVIIPTKESKAQLMKRVIGIPGETIEVKEEKVFVNDSELTENYIQGLTKGDLKKVLGNNEYFVMGDNREKSFDSRDFGAISFQDIVGKIFYEEGREFIPRKLK